MTREEATSLVRRSFTDPDWWVRKILGFKPWETQTQILEAVRDHKFVSVASCHSTGKSAIAACSALWFLYNHYPAVVITTAPTDRQVRRILWKEIRLRHGGSRVSLGGTCLTCDLNLAPNWFATGFTASDYDPDKFQGLHEENILVIPDEACGITEEINEAIESIMAGGNAKKLSIGNPTDPNTPFGSSFRDPDVHKIHVGAYDTPNFTEFGITEQDIVENSWKAKVTGDYPMPMLITPEYAYGVFKRTGVNHPTYLARVAGKFPAESEDSLFGMAAIEAARARELQPSGLVELACDVARFGSDETVIGVRQGPVARILERRTKEETMTTVGRLRVLRKKHKADVIKVDSIGVGAGVCDRLRELGEPVVDINFGSKPDVMGDGAIEFLNLRAQAYWTLYERVQSGDIDLPDDDETQHQLSSIRWKPTSSGKVQIESKEDMKKRGIPSPDIADMLAIAYLRCGRLPGDYGVTL
jgi:hypothetical protein